MSDTAATRVSPDAEIERLMRELVNAVVGGRLTDSAAYALISSACIAADPDRFHYYGNEEAQKAVADAAADRALKRLREAAEACRAK